MQDKFKENLLRGSINFNKETFGLNVFGNWIGTNRMLDDFYKQPEINIINDVRGLNLKNSMRHIVGSSKYQQDYGFLAQPFGYVKEGWDIITEPFIYMYQNKSLNYPKYLYKTLIDTSVDLKNNKIGRDFVKQTPNATDEDIMQYALKKAKENYKQQYDRQNLIRRLLEDDTK